VSRREYEIALQFVKQNYRELLQYAAAVVLTPSQFFPVGQTGQCSHDNFCSISDGITTVGEYVDTIVHELTHAKQNRLGSKLIGLPREEEAYQAGIEAANFYETKAAPWSKA